MENEIAQKQSKLTSEDIVFCNKIFKITSLLAKILLSVSIVSLVIGLFIPLSNKYEYYDFYLLRSWLIRGPGLACIVVYGIELFAKFLLYGYKTLIRGFYKNPWNICFFVMLIWLFVSLRSLPYTSNYDKDLLETSIFGYGYVFEGLVGYVSYFGFYLAGTMIRSDKDRNFLFNLLLGVTAVISFFTLLSDRFNVPFILERNGMTYPFSGTYINPNHFGYLLCVTFAISLWKFYSSKTTKCSAIYLGLLVLNIITLAESNTFGSFLAAIFALLIGSIFYAKQYKKQSFAKITTVILLFICLSSGHNRHMVYVEVPGFFKDIFDVFRNLTRAANTGDIEGTIGSMSGVTDTNRIKVWLEGIKILKKNLIFGVGPDMANNAYWTSRTYGKTMVAHNEYLHIAMCGGLLAGILYFGGVIWLIIRCLRKFKNMPDTIRISSLALGTYAVSAFFGITLPIAAFIFWTMMGLTNSWFQNQIDKKLLEERI